MSMPFVYRPRTSGTFTGGFTFHQTDVKFTPSKFVNDGVIDCSMCYEPATEFRHTEKLGYGYCKLHAPKRRTT